MLLRRTKGKKTKLICGVERARACRLARSSTIDVRSSCMFHLDQSSSSAFDLTCKRLSRGPEAAPTFLGTAPASAAVTTLLFLATAGVALDIEKL